MHEKCFHSLSLQQLCHHIKFVLIFVTYVTGTVIGTVSATDPDNDYIMIRFPVYETESKSLIVINQTTNEPGQASAELILNTKLDRDYV